jgi:hypothetical protein
LSSRNEKSVTESSKDKTSEQDEGGSSVRGIQKEINGVTKNNKMFEGGEPEIKLNSKSNN